LPGYKGDIHDIEFLVRKMNIRTLEEIEKHIERFYPYDGLTSSAEEIIKGLLPNAGEEEPK